MHEVSVAPEPRHCTVKFGKLRVSAAVLQHDHLNFADGKSGRVFRFATEGRQAAG